MEQENLKLDKELEKDLKDCRKAAEFLEKILAMLVKGFAPEY